VGLGWWGLVVSLMAHAGLNEDLSGVCVCGGGGILGPYTDLNLADCSAPVHQC
jgi:hypothetical protein